MCGFLFFFMNEPPGLKKEPCEGAKGSSCSIGNHIRDFEAPAQMHGALRKLNSHPYGRGASRCKPYSSHRHLAPSSLSLPVEQHSHGESPKHEGMGYLVGAGKQGNVFIPKGLWRQGEP